jgi:hypothetical protein
LVAGRNYQVELKEKKGKKELKKFTRVITAEYKLGKITIK